MRCTRCDSIILHETVNRLPDGRLVFGWCEECLEAAGCTKDQKGERPRERQRSRPAKARSSGRSLASGDARRLSLLGIAGLMAAWGLILAFVGGWRWPTHTAAPPNAIGNGTSAVLIGGGGVMALVSLGIWMAILGRSLRRQFVLKFVEVAGALAALAVLGWGIVMHEPRRDPLLVALAAAALWIAWLARMASTRRKRVSQPDSVL